MKGHTIVSMAEKIATAAHGGQLDKSGVPYITHPQRVASSLVGDTLAQATAWLHDVIEDTPITAAHLLVRGIPVEVVAAVEAVTKRPSEQPDDYYSRMRTNPLALKVKLADIGDNSDPIRLALLHPDTANRLRSKYAHAVETLCIAKVNHPYSGLT